MSKGHHSKNKPRRVWGALGMLLLAALGAQVFLGDRIMMFGHSLLQRYGVISPSEVMVDYALPAQLLDVTPARPVPPDQLYNVLAVVLRESLRLPTVRIRIPKIPPEAFVEKKVVQEAAFADLLIPTENSGAPGLPMRMTIPNIAVDAEIEKVALAADGSMDVPGHPLSTAWYKLGPRPGEVGSAAIAGHVNWKNGATAVFANLHKLKKGDKIFVKDDRGVVISFIVRESRSYDAGADATEIFTSNDDKAHLNIITCSGKWDKVAKQYSKRLVVFADKE